MGAGHNHVWAYDFVEDRTRDGRKLRMLNVVDEFTRECLAIRVGRKLGSAEVIDVLADLWDCREFRVSPVRMGLKELPHGPRHARLHPLGQRP